MSESLPPEGDALPSGLPSGLPAEELRALLVDVVAVALCQLLHADAALTTSDGRAAVPRFHTPRATSNSGGSAMRTP